MGTLKKIDESTLQVLCDCEKFVHELTRDGKKLKLETFIVKGKENEKRKREERTSFFPFDDDTDESEERDK